MKSLTFLLILILALAPLPVFAAKACYTPEQMNAEQWLRLHSELMVITVTCRQGSLGQDLPALYGRFTQKHLSRLHEAEQTLMGYYRQSVKGDATEHLDRLRTVLANEFGQKSANMSAVSFCEAYRDKVEQFTAATPETVSHEVILMEKTERSYAPLCGTPKASEKKGG